MLSSTIHPRAGRRHAVVTAAVGAVLATLALSSCASTTSTSTAHVGAAVDKKLAALVPSSIRKAGSITIATSGSTAPAEYVKAGSSAVVGYDIDLIKAVGAELGLTVKIDNVPFDGIVPGIQSGRYDAAISTFAISAAREKIIDMVAYGTAGGQLLLSPDLKSSPVTPEDLCGLKVSVLQGSVDLTRVQQASKTCTTGGKKAINIQVFPDENSAVLAVVSQHVDASIFNSISAGYTAAQTNGKVVLAKGLYDTAQLGVAVPRSPGLAKAISAALQKLADDGKYKAILKKWNASAAAIPANLMIVDPKPAF